YRHGAAFGDLHRPDFLAGDRVPQADHARPLLHSQPARRLVTGRGHQLAAGVVCQRLDPTGVPLEATQELATGDLPDGQGVAPGVVRPPPPRAAGAAHAFATPLETTAAEDAVETARYPSPSPLGHRSREAWEVAVEPGHGGDEQFAIGRENHVA